ncbi:endonuclease/exonuclease/phosphatase [Actinomadura gamaensis]|uniref:Endonuclease/exonuclease/phosphatase n=1 Tax=Actinomadura gamaensis TaxID=1763541 RepID=A0ABV9TRT8_9ACTN
MTRSAPIGRAAASLAGAVLAVPLAAAPAGAVALAGAVAPADPGGAPVSARVRDVQGAGHVSPLNGRDVTGVGGVATAVTDGGFWMQDPAPAGTGTGSSGIFVFTRTRPQVRPGDAVRVSGRVSEFRPGGSGSSNLSRTEIDATETVVSSHDQPLPPPVVLGGPKGRRAPASFPAVPRDAETDRTFDPKSDPLAFYSSLEGMRVRVENAVVVGPTRDGALPVLPAGGAGTSGAGTSGAGTSGPGTSGAGTSGAGTSGAGADGAGNSGAGAGDRTRRGGSLAGPGGLPDPARIVLSDALAPLPSADVGDRLPGPVDGVLDYTAAGFVLLPTATPARANGGLKPQAAPPAGQDELSVGTLNLEGISPDTPSDRIGQLADDLVHGLASPDLVTVTGVEDNSGAADDGTVAADQTVSELITAISAAGGPAYEWRSVAPHDNADGGERGGNGRIGFLFRSDRGLAFADRPSGSSDLGAPGVPDLAVAPTHVQPDGRGGARLTLSPGRVAPSDPAWAETRKPLAGELTWRGRRIVVVANHWYGRTSADPIAYGRRQPLDRPSEARREAQAKVVADFVRTVRRAAPDADVIVTGNLGTGDGSPALRALTAPDVGLRDLSSELAPRDRYTADSGGAAEDLDHILLSPALAKRPHRYQIVHRASEFADRAGDHDPSLVRITLAPPAKPASDPVAQPGGPAERPDAPLPAP